jgi:hypothetical protein
MGLGPCLRPDSHGTDHQGHVEHRSPSARALGEGDAAGRRRRQRNNGNHDHLEGGQTRGAPGRGVPTETGDVQCIEGGRDQVTVSPETETETETVQGQCREPSRGHEHGYPGRS